MSSDNNLALPASASVTMSSKLNLTGKNALVDTIKKILVAEFLQELCQAGTITPQSISEAKAKTLLGALQDHSIIEEILLSLSATATRDSGGADSPQSEIDPDSPAEPPVDLERSAPEENESADSDQRHDTGLEVIEFAYAYFDQRKYELAFKIYMDIVRYLQGLSFSLPGWANDEYGVESPGYRLLSERCRYLMMLCFQGLSDCAFIRSLGRNPGQTLAWMSESEILVKNRWYGDGGVEPVYDWFRASSLVQHPFMALKYADCLVKKAEVFEILSNSSAYQYNLTMVTLLVFTLPLLGGSSELVEAAESLRLRLLVKLKEQKDGVLSGHHPDPDSDRRFLIIAPAFQVRGAWRKVPAATGEVPPGKSAYSVFIWGGHLYVARARDGGGLGSQPPLAELWRMNLKNHDKWEFVTKFPAVRGKGAFNRVLVNKNKLYAYVGHPLLDILDLTTNKWTTVKTTWKPTTKDRQAGVDPIWPWTTKCFADAALEIVGDRLFVFGGFNGPSTTGCNLFMELDLKSLKWRRLSGTPLITECYDPRVPGPRTGPGIWTSQDEKKLYIFSGSCHKAHQLKDDRYGPPDTWMYDDLWSWDIAAQTWREEKVLGNPPSPRIGMGYIFSKKLNTTIVFGGLNRTCTTVIGESSDSQIYQVYYADTFLWNPPKARTGSAPQPGYWKQIQTVGFPTYRTNCCLAIDPDTDDIYLYGGEVPGETIPSRNHTEVQRRRRMKYETPIAEQMASRPDLAELARELGFQGLGKKTFTQRFGDLWKLHINVPGGNFECINMEDEMRTSPLGPWDRCFECRKAGFWKKCGGSCGGKAFFCGTECQKKGWAEHKNLNGCKKVGKSRSDSKA